jgi:hypothetical protein
VIVLVAATSHSCRANCVDSNVHVTVPLRLTGRTRSLLNTFQYYSVFIFSNLWLIFAATRQMTREQVTVAALSAILKIRGHLQLWDTNLERLSPHTKLYLGIAASRTPAGCIEG